MDHMDLQQAVQEDLQREPQARAAHAAPSESAMPAPARAW
jgi:hypothetical protein